MIALLAVTLLVKCVSSLPATPRVLENDGDVKVMKCVVEALADVLNRPRPLPVSQECLQTLRSDKSLLSLLRHYDFLTELRDVATHGGKERARPQRGAMAPDHVTNTPLNVEGDVPDRSMLDSLGGPGERSILGMSASPTDFHTDDEEEDKRSAVFSQRSQEDQSEEQEEMQRSRKKSLGGDEEQQEEAHHSKEEVTKRKEKMEKKRSRTPEEKELQMIAGRGLEEEGSAGRKTEQDAGVESLSAIESELEDVAQKLHELRRG